MTTPKGVNDEKSKRKETTINSRTKGGPQNHPTLPARAPRETECPPLTGQEGRCSAGRGGAKGALMVPGHAGTRGRIGTRGARPRPDRPTDEGKEAQGARTQGGEPKTGATRHCGVCGPSAKEMCASAGREVQTDGEASVAERRGHSTMLEGKQSRVCGRHRGSLPCETAKADEAESTVPRVAERSRSSRAG